MLHDLAISSHRYVIATDQRCTPVSIVKHLIRIIICDLMTYNLEPALDLFACQLAVSVRIQHFECLAECSVCERRRLIPCAHDGTTTVGAPRSTSPG